jgi:integrase
MAKLPKGLYQRGSIFWTKVYQHGRPIYQSTGTSNLTEAKRILDVRRGTAQRGESVLPQVDRVRWEEAQADLIAYYEATGKRDVAEAKNRAAHLGLYFAGWRIARIDTPAVHGYVVHRKQQKAAPATINRELATLSKGLRVAHQNKKLAGQPPRIEKLQEDNIRQGFFEREQFEAVRKHLPAYAKPVVTFMYLTGWRIRSEVLPLQWRQVDFQAGTVRLEPGTTKNKEGRTFYLTPELRTCLEAQRAATEALQRQTGCIIPWVFHREGTPMKSFWKAWKTACKAAGAPGRIPHDFRRTAVRNLERAGVPRSVAMKMVGHKTEAIYRRYAIVSDADLQDAAKKLARVQASRRGTRQLVDQRPGLH